MKTKRYLNQLFDELSVSEEEQASLRCAFNGLLEATPIRHDCNLLMLTEIMMDWAMTSPDDYAAFISPLTEKKSEQTLHSIQGLWFLEKWLEEFNSASPFTLKQEGCFEIHRTMSPLDRTVTATALSLCILAHRHLPVPNEDICPMSRNFKN